MSGILNLLLAGAASVVKDAYFNLVTLLLNTTATNGAQNNTFLDSSSNNFSITRNGNTTQGTFTPFSQTGWSNYFNGSSYLSVPDNSALEVGSSNFTVEAWVYLISNQGNGSAVISKAAGTSFSPFMLALSGAGYMNFYCSSSGSGWDATTGDTAIFPSNTWVHVAGVRNGNTFTLYKNGVAVGTPATLSGSLWNNTESLLVGWINYASAYWNGYISNARLVIGTAVYTSNFTPSTTPLTAITNTAFLSCQSNRFLDNSTNAFAITANGTPSVQAFSPFAPTTAYSTSLVGGSGYFDGSGDYLNFIDSSNNLDLGGLQASFDAWVYVTNTSNGILLNKSDSSIGGWSDIEYQIYPYETGQFTFVYNVSNSATILRGGAIGLNQWAHICVATDASNNIAMFLNGVRVATATNAITKPTNRTYMFVGSQTAGNGPFFGYASSTRFIKGSGAYDPTQTTITIPTAPPSNTGTTQLLLNCTNAGIYDAAAKNVNETLSNAQVSTTTAKWGTTSMYFDGSSSYLKFPASANLAVNSGNFTYEFWLYPTTNSDNCLFDTRAANLNTSGFAFLIRSSVNLFVYTNANDLTCNSAITQNAWQHVALVRSGSTMTAYVSGTSVGSVTFSNNLTDQTLSIASYVGGGGYLNGYMDDVRITKGYARYTANFTPPAASFPIQ
jgi:hypothetical protein